jgi:hypothetical protein
MTVFQRYKKRINRRLLEDENFLQNINIDSFVEVKEKVNLSKSKTEIRKIIKKAKQLK